MKFLIVSLALVAVVAADVSHLVSKSEADATIIKSDSDVLPDGYHFSYQTSNGISAQEQGELKNVGQKNEGISVKGSAEWTAADGTPIKLSYVADENGYQPQGAHLPTSPPIPDYILRSLEYIKTHPSKESLNHENKEITGTDTTINL